MSRVRAAKIVAKELRENNEKRRKKIKNKASKFSGGHEFLQSTSRKRGTSVHDVDMELLAEIESSSSSEGDLSSDEETTQTHMLYKELMKDRKFLFSF